MDISQIRQAALNSLYAHKKHLDSLRHKTDDDIEVIDVKPAMTKPMSLPLPRQKPTPYPRQHAPPPPVGAKPTFLGLLGDHPVYQSVFDLRRLGLRFDEILQQSGCSEAFLRDVFKQLGYSVELPVGAVPKVVTKALTVPPPGVSPRVMTFEEFRKTREASGTPSEPHTPSFHSPALTSHAFTPTISTPLVSVRSIPRFGEKSRRQKRLCIEISDSESDSDDALAKKHKDMSLEETRQEIARIQALIAQTSGAKNGHRESSEPNESSERSGTGEPSESHSEEEAVDVSATPVAASLAVSAAASPSLAHTKAVPSVPAPQLDPSVAAYLAAKNIALDSLTPVQLDKIVQIVKLKTLLQGEEDAFTTSLQKIPHTEIPSPAPRQPNSRDASGLDSEQGRDAAQQPPQPARVQQTRETQDSSYRSPLAAFRSHKFGPLSPLSTGTRLPHVDSESSDSLGDGGQDTISLAEFKPSELPLCPYELQGVCNDSKCEQYAHWRDLRLSPSERILEIMRAFVGDSPEQQKQYKTELNVRLKELKGADFHTILPALTRFRNQHITDGSFLDWYAFNRVDVQTN